MGRTQRTFPLALGSGDEGQQRQERYEQAAEKANKTRTRWMLDILDKAAKRILTK
jgi:hypothetical protein